MSNEAPISGQIKRMPATIEGPKVYGAISACTAELLGGVAKDRQTSGFASFKFRGIDEFMNAVAPVIARNFLVILPRAIGEPTRIEKETQAGKAMYFTHITVEFDFVSTIDGSMHTVRTFGEAQDSGDKSTNKAMSAAFKYALMQAFCIPTENMQDADATTHEPMKPSGGVDLAPLIVVKDRVKAAILKAATVDEIDAVRGSADYQAIMTNSDYPRHWAPSLSGLATNRATELSL